MPLAARGDGEEWEGKGGKGGDGRCRKAGVGGAGTGDLLEKAEICVRDAFTVDDLYYE